MIGKLLIGGVITAFVIQIIPYGKTYTNPPIVDEPSLCKLSFKSNSLSLV